MCFSAPASFSASAVLMIIGVLTINKTKTNKELLFASIPILFAIQQLVEGLLWLELAGGGWWLLSGSDAQHFLTQSYAVFVGVVWPILPSLSLLLLEPKPPRKNSMLVILAVGVGIAIYTLNQITIYPISASVAENCITYGYPTPQPHFMLVFYVIATCAAFFISSHRFVWWLGMVNIVAFSVSYHFYSYDLTSVWCFFAAAISGLIYWHFHKRT